MQRSPSSVLLKSPRARIESHGMPTLQPEIELNGIRAANKTFRHIEQAIRSYLNKAARPGKAARAEAHLSNGTPLINDGENGYPSVVHELAKILNWEEKNVALKKVDLFYEAFQDWSPKDDTKSSPAYITVQALCIVDPEMAFKKPEKVDMKKGKDNKKKKDDSDSTPFVAAAEAGAAELIEVMIAELLKFLEKNYLDAQDLGKSAQDEDDKKEAKEKHLKTKAQKEYLSVPGKEGKSEMTAFRLAAEELQYDVLKLLLKDFPGLAEMNSVSATIRKTASHANEEQDAALKVFKLILEHMTVTPDDARKIWQEAVRYSSLKVVRYLLNETGSMDIEIFATYENARFVMKRGTKDMWNEFNDSQHRHLLLEMPDGNGDLLHTAVESGNADIVEEIIEKFPHQVEVVVGSKDNPRYPMQFLGKADQAGKHRDNYNRIRNALLHAMIRSTSEDMGIREIRKILDDSKVEADTICLHLSNIDTEEQKFSEYVQWLRDQGETMGKIFKFERILKYAKFPDLHIQTPKHSDDVAASLREDHSEIKSVFDWLEKRHVKQILELSVPDRLFSPHSDANVAHCVVNWSVRILNWRKLDLYLGNLKNKQDLQELYLYSSGNQSVHDHWYQELPKFTNLRRLWVYVVADVLSQKRIAEVMSELQNRLDDINREVVQKRWTEGRPGLEREKKGKFKGELKVPVKDYSWVTDTRYRTYRNLTDITNDIVGPNLASFISKYQSAMSKRAEIIRTKVALIDSGVVIVGGKAKAQDLAQTAEDKKQAAEEYEPGSDENAEPAKTRTKLHRRDKLQWSTDDLAYRIVDGKSFVNTGDDEEQVWWHASEPHGTQMARLICSIDPCCDLYVIKVAETRSSGISANIVAEAIRWAISRDVDVISLSLVAYTNTERMSEAIKEASLKDIVILSSTADEGVRVKESAASLDDHRNNHDVFTIAASDRWGNLLHRSQKEGYDYRFIGHNVHVGQVPFLKSSETISGSSVATAIAAGTASLIVACGKISKNCKMEPRWRCRLITNRFREMLEGSNKLKYVVLENLCGKGKAVETLSFQSMVDASFPLAKKPK